jgi:hypothetical protein
MSPISRFSLGALGLVLQPPEKKARARKRAAAPPAKRGRRAPPPVADPGNGAVEQGELPK